MGQKQEVCVPEISALSREHYFSFSLENLHQETQVILAVVQQQTRWSQGLELFL